MEKKDAIGAAQIAGGTYLGYQGLNHGLPRALGLRIEYHTTSKKNAKLIKEAGNILDPKHGGKSGWAEKSKCDSYVNSSKNFVHITGFHRNAESKILEEFPIVEKCNFLLAPVRTIFRKFQTILYKGFGNMDKDLVGILNGEVKNKKDIPIAKAVLKTIKNNLFNNQTKRFCIPGIDSFFNTNFIPDADDMALKTTKQVKVYNNRFKATVAGLKQFGLKGIKENKSRFAAGVATLAAGIFAGTKLIEKGINNLQPEKQTNPNHTPAPIQTS